MEKQLRDFDDKALIRTFKLFSAAAALVLLYAFFFSGFQIVDEFGWSAREKFRIKIFLNIIIPCCGI